MKSYRLRNKPVSRLISPNSRRRPAGVTPSLIVLHWTAGEWAGALRTLTSEDAGVSAHFLIGRDGRTFQLVDTDLVAYHAGVSSWEGKANVNNFSIGIELVHLGKPGEPWTEAQLLACAEIIVQCQRYYQIHRVVGHLDVSPGRKVDPGKDFPWTMLRRYMLDAKATI